MYAIWRGRGAKHAWYWRVQFRRRGREIARTFYEQKHGGRAKALAAAIAWRDAQLRETDVLTLRDFNAYRRSNNTSGVPGVHFLRPKRQPLGIWQAKVKLPNGRKLHCTFSVSRFGEREAFRRAVAARKRLLDLVPDRLYLRSVVAKRFAR